MNVKREILELDLDFDLMDVSPEDLVEDLGISEASTEELFDLIRKGGKEAQEGLENFKRANMIEYHGIGRRYAPVAFELYRRLSKRVEEPRLPTYLSVNRGQSRGCGPDTVIFWDDPDAIRGLYESLEKDGYYACA